MHEYLIFTYNPCEKSRFESFFTHSLNVSANSLLLLRQEGNAELVSCS